MQKVGLILEGGRTKGIYLPYVLSVSIETCNAVNYVSKNKKVFTSKWTKHSIDSLEGKVLILSPSKVLIGRASNNIKQMNEFYRQGWSLTKERLKEIIEFIY